MSMKFLHCADLHLDSPLRGLVAYEGAPVDEIRGATRRSFENLVDLAVEEGVAAVVIAGDVYDGDRDDFNTAMFLQRNFERLRDEGIPVALVHGNHDAANEITRRLRPPDNVFVFPHDSPATHELADAGLSFHGRSYPTRAVHEDLSATYPPPVPGSLNVGVLHTSLSGREGPHQVYAPCTEASLTTRGYDYWALGHIHERFEADRDGTWIVYPGNLQGRKSTETGPKGASVITYDTTGITTVEHRTLDVVRWEVLEVDVSDARDADEVAGSVLSRMAPLIDEADGRLLACRVRITGQNAAAGTIRAGAESWEAQLRADAAGAGARVWIEKIQLQVQDPAGHTVDAGEAIAAVRDAIRHALEDPLVRDELASEFSDVRSKLGVDLDGLLDLGAVGIDADSIAGVLPEVESLLVTELRGTAG